jgi:hypothetical protein
MATCASNARHALQSDLDAAWTMIADATVDVDPNSTSKKSSWPSAPGFTLDSLGKVGKLSPNLSRKPCITWHRPLYWLDFPIPDVPAEDANRPSLLSHAQTMRDADPAPRPQLALPISCITAATAVRFPNGAALKQQAGRHLGHYKSIVQDAKLLSVQVKMMNIAIKNGIELDR